MAPFTWQGSQQVVGTVTTEWVTIYKPFPTLRLEKTAFVVNALAEFVLVPRPGKIKCGSVVTTFFKPFYFVKCLDLIDVTGHRFR